MATHEAPVRTDHDRRAGGPKAIAGLGLVFLVLTVVPACQVAVHCPDVVAQPWWGEIDSIGVQFAGVSGQTINGTVFRPRDVTAFPGRRPAVVVLHGFDQDECYQWWSAWALAGHGYVTMAFTSAPQTQLGNTRLAISWLASADHPWLDQTDMNRLGLLGHSAAGVVESWVQATDLRVKAYVDFDNLSRMSLGCPDAPGVTPKAYELPVRTPGMGVARDSTCDLTPEAGSPDEKVAGFEKLRSSGIPSAEFVARGAVHNDFTTAGSDVVHRRAFFVTKAWFDHWLAGDSTALTSVMSGTWDGTPRSTVLSPYYRSAIATPTVTCLDLRTCPAARR